MEHFTFTPDAYSVFSSVSTDDMLTLGLLRFQQTSFAYHFNLSHETLIFFNKKQRNKQIHKWGIFLQIFTYYTKWCYSIKNDLTLLLCFLLENLTNRLILSRGLPPPAWRRVENVWKEGLGKGSWGEDIYSHISKWIPKNYWYKFYEIIFLFWNLHMK